jgi:hypothetical protein
MTGQMRSVRLWDAYGRPLLAEYDLEEPEPYRRRLMGFLPIDERKSVHESLHGSGTFGPPESPVPQLYNDIESIILTEEEEEED